MICGVCALRVAPEASPAAGLSLSLLLRAGAPGPSPVPAFLPAFLSGKPSYKHTVCSAYCRDKDILAKGTSDNGIVGQIGELLSHEDSGAG